MADINPFGTLSFMQARHIQGSTQPRILGGLTAMGDSGENELERLIASLEVQAPTPPPKLSPGRTALGVIGDALLAAGRVRSGGQAPDIGPFASLLINRRHAFESATAEATAANRDLRNRIRIGEFGAKRTEEAEIRKEGRIRAAKTAEAEVKATAEQEKERIKIEGDVRKGFIDKILELGIDTKGRDLLTASTADLKEIIDAADPSASINTILQHLPPDMDINKVHIDKNGKLSFDIEKKDGKAKEFPSFLASALISAGEDPSSYIENPVWAAGARRAAEANKRKLLDQNADTFLEDVEKSAGADEESIVSQFTASVAMDLRMMGKAGASPQEVMAYYADEVDTMASAIESKQVSEEQATDYLTRVRHMIRVRFPDLVLPALEPLVKEKAPAEAAKPPGPPSAISQQVGKAAAGIGRSVAGLGKGLGAAVGGILSIPSILSGSTASIAGR